MLCPCISPDILIQQFSEHIRSFRPFFYFYFCFKFIQNFLNGRIVLVLYYFCFIYIIEAYKVIEDFNLLKKLEMHNILS